MLQRDSFERTDHDQYEPKSAFTYRDLRNLSRYNTSCPLRVIGLIDFDAFYAQCETVRLGLPPDQPLVVVQFGFCIAVNYAAKAAGLKRVASPVEAKAKCPDVVLQHVATWREGDPNWAYRKDNKESMTTDKAALDPYRKQSRAAFQLIKSLLPKAPLQKVEKASIDEVFVDLSAQVYQLLLEKYPELVRGINRGDTDERLPMPNISFLDWNEDSIVEIGIEAEEQPIDWDDVALNIGAEIVRNIRAGILDKFKYTCSAGISHNKSVAKLAAGHNKPNKQTVVRRRAVTNLYNEYKFTKIRGLGGKLGAKAVEAFDTDQVSDLLHISQREMRAKLGSESTWLYNIIRGVDHADVVERTLLQSMLAQKTFVPKARGHAQADPWLRIMVGDLIGRLEEQEATSKSRRPRVITLHHSIDGRHGPMRSKQTQIPLGAIINADLLFDMSRNLLVQISQEGPAWPCLVISVAVSNFEDSVSENTNLTSYFTPLNRHQIVDEDVNTLQLKRRRSEDDLDMVGQRTASERTAEPGLYDCPNCHKSVPHAEVLEHLDWHVAVELQNSSSQQT